MSNPSKRKGTTAERDVVTYLRDNGFPFAERRALHGSKDLGDVTGTPGLVWEVKAGEAAHRASDGLVAKWLEQTETERANANAAAGILIIKRAGKGSASVAHWWAIAPVSTFTGHSEASQIPMRVTLAHAVQLLRRAGYGNPLAVTA